MMLYYIISYHITLYNLHICSYYVYIYIYIHIVQVISYLSLYIYIYIVHFIFILCYMDSPRGDPGEHREEDEDRPPRTHRI